jgi:CheY-like chemotaxis protein
MMPGRDGWDLLGQFREHPVTQHVPVIICSILGQRDLAMALGAADFLRKPVTRQDLLAALDRLLASR